MLVSSFNYIIDDNKDNLELLTYITIPASTITQKTNQIFNLPINVKFNKKTNKFETFSFFNFEYLSYFPLTNNGIKINNEYYLSSRNDQFVYDYSQDKIKNRDDIDIYQLTSLTKHDSLGNFISIIGKIPDSYIKSNLLYGYLTIDFVNISNNLYYSYIYEEAIYGENDVVLFKFKNLPYNSNLGLKGLSIRTKRNREINRFGNLKPNEIGQYCPVSMIKLLNRKDNLLALFTVYEEEHPLKMYYILQEYTTEGDLLSQTYFDDNPENQIKNVFYDAKNDYLCFLRKSNKGWTVEKRSFK